MMAILNWLGIKRFVIRIKNVSSKYYHVFNRFQNPKLSLERIPSMLSLVIT